LLALRVPWWRLLALRVRSARQRVDAMSDRPGPVKRVVLITAIEVLLVAALVFGLGYGGMRWAEARHRRPVRPGGDGSIKLEIRQSDWRGNVSVVEENYVGAWHCEGDWELRWRFAATKPGPYDVAIEAACPAEEAGGPIEIAIGEQTLKRVVPDTGGWWKWKTVPVGPMTLDTSPHTLILKPTGPNGRATMNFNKVILRPVGQTARPAATTQPSH
jgi:hypothetical protein